jgi:hypothetical protein
MTLSTTILVALVSVLLHASSHAAAFQPPHQLILTAGAKAKSSGRSITGTTTAALSRRRQITPNAALHVLFKPDGYYDDNDDDSATVDGLSARYIPIDNYPLECDPDFPCMDGDPRSRSGNSAIDWNSVLVIGIPGITPIVAFSTFEYCGKFYHAVEDFMAARNWVAVDGGGACFCVS